MRILFVLLAYLLAATPAAAERPRTGWNGAAGFSHYFPLTPEERTHLMVIQPSQHPSAPSSARTSGVFAPQPRMAGSSPAPVCGWAGCAQGSSVSSQHTLHSIQTPWVCGWAGCRQDSPAQGRYIDICGWAGCRGAASAAPTFAGGAESGFRDRCGWAGCR